MTRCLDEGKLQSYFDGELSIDLMESVTSHLASCANCAAAARELEEESSLLTSALALELESSVPTARLRERIDAAVLGDRLAVAQTTQKASGLSAFFATLLNFGTQRTLGYASLAVIVAFAAIMGIVKLRTTTPPPESIAKTTPPAANNGDAVAVNTGNEGVRGAPAEVQQIEVTGPRQSRNSAPQYHPVKASFKSNAAPAPERVKLIPGERTYLQTIAKLDSTIKSNKKSMRPALQVEYERNLAVVDRAIAATRSAVKSNPNDPDAADFMFAAYQSKVDLLNTIADARVGNGGRGH